MEQVSTPSLLEAIDEHLTSGDHLFGIFLADSIELPLLTPSEEGSLSQSIQTAKPLITRLRGDHHITWSIGQIPVLKNWKRARDLLILCNTPLVTKIARKYTGRGVAFMDLLQNGNVGLIKAVDGYDSRKGRFSTYAYGIIQREIHYGLRNYLLEIGVSNEVYDCINAVAAIYYRLYPDERTPDAALIQQEYNSTRPPENHISLEQTARYIFVALHGAVSLIQDLDEVLMISSNKKTDIEVEVEILRDELRRKYYNN